MSNIFLIWVNHLALKFAAKGVPNLSWIMIEFCEAARGVLLILKVPVSLCSRCHLRLNRFPSPDHFYCPVRFEPWI